MRLKRPPIELCELCEGRDQKMAASPTWVEQKDSVRREFNFGGPASGMLCTKTLKDERHVPNRIVESFLSRFLPLGHPHSVAEGYLTYSQFRAVQHFSSAVMSVLSIRSLLYAAGLRRTPAQATLVSWISRRGRVFYSSTCHPRKQGVFYCSSTCHPSKQGVFYRPALLWRNPWTHVTSGRAYGSPAENREREARVSDEADDENCDDDADEPSELEDEYDVEDEQHIEDSDDNVEEEEVVVERSVKKKKFTPPKTKLPDQEGRCLNEKITARFVRLVGEDGKSHKVVSRHEALTLAKAKNMDLVQVDITSEPPVCKIFDFHKEEYRQAQILKDRKKKKGAMAHLGEVKEIRFTAKTELKDLKMKVEKAEGFTDRGYRVKFVAMFKAKADDEKKRLEEEKIIDSVCSMVKNFAIIEQGPRVESRQAWVILRHVKFAKNSSPKHKNQTVKSIEQKEQELHVMDRLSKQAKGE